MRTVNSPQPFLLAGPDAVCTCIPYLVGYPPMGSVVVVWLECGALRLTMRIDSPGAGVDLADWVDSCRHSPSGSDEIIICAFGERGDSENLPWADAVGSLVEEIGDTCVVRDALFCDGERWWSYLCSDEDCCPAGGTPIDDSTRLGVAAHFAYEGVVVLPDRGAISGSLAPVEDAAVRAAVLRASATLPRSIISSQALDSWRDESIAVLLAWVRDGEHVVPPGKAAGASATAFIESDRGDADAVAACLLGLLDLRVRDVVLWELARLGDLRPALERAISLLRRAPEGLRAPIASLAGVLAWQCGDGVRAQIAVQIALADDAEYSFALLLARSLRSGLPPAQWREVMAGLSREECRAGAEGVAS